MANRPKPLEKPLDKPLELDELTASGQRTWSSGDFHEIARQTMGVAETLCRDADPRPGQAVLDVACGSGNLALLAARRYCAVSGIDIAPNLIDRARQRAAAERVSVNFLVGDAQNLPFPDASFDMVASIFGVMFAPDQQKTAHELLRVCRPGGRIALANWMPDAFGKDFFSAHARHAPPPAGAPSPLQWGTDEGLARLLGDGVASLQSARRSSFAYYLSIDHALDLHNAFFGPTIRARETVGEAGAQALRDDLGRVFETYNRSAGDGAVIEYEYLQTIAIRA